MDEEKGAAGAGAASAARSCPICGKPRVQEYRPFCSKRCADIDLGRWLNGAYVVAGEPDADEDGLSPSGELAPAGDRGTDATRDG